MAAKTGRWIVVCDDYTTKPFASREAAERARAQVEEAGHCRAPHEVREVAANA